MGLLKLLQKERKNRNANVTLKAIGHRGEINPQTPQTKPSRFHLTGIVCVVLRQAKEHLHEGKPLLGSAGICSTPALRRQEATRFTEGESGRPGLRGKPCFEPPPTNKNPTTKNTQTSNKRRKRVSVCCPPFYCVSAVWALFVMFSITLNQKLAILADWLARSWVCHLHPTTLELQACRAMPVF